MRRILLIGSGGYFTQAVLQALVGLKVIPSAYWQSSPLPAVVEQRLAGVRIDSGGAHTKLPALLNQHRIEARGGCLDQLENDLQSLTFDFLLVACWPKLIDISRLGSIRCAALNLHPSLLPGYRGIDPVAAQIKAREQVFGTTLHLLSDQFDAGAIIAQQAFTLPTASYREIEHKAALTGAALFVEALQDYPAWSPMDQEINLP